MTKEIVPSEALDQHIAVLGKTGSGKTYAAKSIVERLLGQRRQVCVLDPTSAWWGLRLGADGKSRGFDMVLLGGKHADIPLADRSGEAVARLVTQQRANAVIDTSGMTVGQYTRWFIDFAGTLYTTIREPLHLVIDEAHYFMPQSGGGRMDVDAGKMLHNGNRLMSGGRSLGVRGLMITQRPAKLHKDALTCADTLIAMRVIAPQDRAAIKAWIDGAGDQEKGAEVLDSLAQLQRGEGWVWHPESEFLKRVTFPAIKTYDSSATPKHGAASAPNVAAINLDEVKNAMAEAVKEAEANDPKLLRAKIADLEKQLKQRPKATERIEVEKVVEVPVLKNGQLESLKSSVEEIRAAANQLNNLGAELGSAMAEAVRKPASNRAIAPARPAPTAPVRNQPQPASEDDAPIGGGLRRILTALAQRNGLSARQVGVRAGLSSSSGTFGTYLGRARAAGWIVGGRDRLEISESGIEALGDYDPLPSGPELLDYWLGELGDSGAARILRALANVYPRALSKEETGERAGLSASSGTFGTYLGKLRTLELVEGRGELRASAELFE